MPYNVSSSSGSAAPPAATAAGHVRAILQHGYGGPEVLRMGTIPRPLPGAGEVLVRVAAAGVDRGTWHVMTGRPLVARLALGLRRPKRDVPGLDVAGTVEEVGPGVSRFSPGDEVFGIAKGSLAALALAEEAKLDHRPPSLTPEQAAAVPVSGLTALQAVRDIGRVTAGQRVLVLGASGGVGSFAVQVAGALGAEVTGVCSAAKADFVRSLGVARVLPYDAGGAADAIAGSGRYDVVVDIGGNRPLRTLRRSLTPRGTLVVVGGEGGGRWLGGIDRSLRAALWSPLLRQRLTMFVATERHDGLADLVTMTTPAIDRTFPLAETAAAVEHLASGAVRGKLVVVVDD